MYNMKLNSYQREKMTNKITLTTLMLATLGITSCSNTSTPMKYNINKEKNIEHIQRSFDIYKGHNGYKAMAIAMDREGKYVIGYSFDCGSIESAKKIAFSNCTNANDKAEVKAEANCKIYAVDNAIVSPLK